MSKKTEFKIVYDGESLRDHTMDIKDLAPALLSLAQLFDESNRVLNGEKVKVNLQVKAVGEGSFETLLTLWQESQVVAEFFGKDEFVNAKTMIEFIFGSASLGGLWGLIKWLANKNKYRIEKIDEELLRIIDEDGKSHIVKKEVLELYKDIAVRKSSEEILKPLERDGIELFSVRDGDEELQRIEQKDIELFEIGDGEEEILYETEMEVAYSITTLSFKEGNKWRLSDGNSTLWVNILDNEFLQKVNENKISFSKGDILFCKVKITQYTIHDEVRTKHEIIKVSDHKHASKQIDLFEDK